MKFASRSEDEKLAAISEDEMSDNKMRTVVSYLSSTYVVSVTATIAEAAELSKAIAKSRQKTLSSSLVKTKSYCLCLQVYTKDLLKLLPIICEHSERVFIGYDYAYIIREHGKTLIGEDAISILSS